jgi:hypothetical protein
VFEVAAFRYPSDRVKDSSLDKNCFPEGETDGVNDIVDCPPGKGRRITKM